MGQESGLIHFVVSPPSNYEGVLITKREFLGPEKRSHLAVIIVYSRKSLCGLGVLWNGFTFSTPTLVTIEGEVLRSHGNIILVHLQ